MRAEINEMEFEIRKSFYHKTKVQEDGITHIVDTSNTYTVYQFGLAKNYFVSTKAELIDGLISDLKTLTKQLEELRSKDTDIDDEKGFTK